jgi:hypothetical protein
MRDDERLSVALEASEFDGEFLVTDPYAPNQSQSMSIFRILVDLAYAFSLHSKSGRNEPQNLGVWDRVLDG